MKMRTLPGPCWACVRVATRQALQGEVLDPLDLTNRLQVTLHQNPVAGGVGSSLERRAMSDWPLVAIHDDWMIHITACL